MQSENMLKTCLPIFGHYGLDGSNSLNVWDYSDLPAREKKTEDNAIYLFIYLFVYLFIYLFIYFLFKVDLNVSYKKPPFLFFVWKVLDDHKFLLFWEQVTIFLKLFKIWSRTISYRIVILTLKKVSFSKIIKDSLINFKYIIHNARW